MADYLLKKWKEEVGSIAKSRGFKSRDTYFVKITDECVLQSFCLSRIHLCYSVRFYMCPLSAGVRSHKIDGDEIVSLWGEPVKDWGLELLPWFADDPEAVYDKIAFEMAEKINEYIIPYFADRETLAAAQETESKRGHMTSKYALACYCLQTGNFNAAEEYIQEILNVWKPELNATDEDLEQMGYKTDEKKAERREFFLWRTGTYRDMHNALATHDKHVIEAFALKAESELLEKWRWPKKETAEILQRQSALFESL
jgi:hypothetical protein